MRHVELLQVRGALGRDDDRADDQRHRYGRNAQPQGGGCPYTMSQLKTVVECRGGDYFFIPSITALRMLTMGVIDPT